MHDFFTDFGIFLFAQYRARVGETFTITNTRTQQQKNKQKPGVSKHSGACGDVTKARK